MLITGGCLCKAVRYEVTAAPIVTRVCWCRLCQYLGSGSGTVNTCFPKQAVTVQGDLADFQSIADSGNKMHRRVSYVLGARTFCQTPRLPPLLFIPVRTF